MKLNEIITESTDVVARFYKDARADQDRKYNPEADKYRITNSDYYKEFFPDWEENQVTPVFTKPTANSQSQYSVTPRADKLQSPGYRGLQYALAAAGLPYNHDVQQHKVDPARLLATQSIDALKSTMF